MSSKKSTIRDVSQLAGVSISTVSRVLNNQERAKTIPEELRQQVRRAAKQLNYVPNANARRIFSHRAGIIGLLVPSYTRMKMHIFEDGHLIRLISGIEAGIKGSDYRLLLIFNDRHFIDKCEYMSLIQSQNIDGLLVWGAQPGEDYWNEPVDAGLPVLFVVTVPCESERCSYTISAVRAGTEKALNHLISHGHRRILQLCEVRNTFLERYMDEAVEDARKQIPGLTIEPQNILHSGSEIDVSLFRRPEAPTAVLAYNYAMAEDAYRKLTEHGIRIPEEVELVSCYSFQSRKNWITSVVVDDFEIGRTGVRKLQKLIDAPAQKFRDEIPFSFFSGRTTRNTPDIPIS